MKKNWTVELSMYETVEDVEAETEQEAIDKAKKQATEFPSSDWEVEDCYSEDDEE